MNSLDCNSTIKPEEFIQFAEHLATISGEIARQYYRKDISFKVKGDASPVTVADKEIERNVRAAIGASYPNHGIVGEEYDPVNIDADYRWVVDPIDGTKSFMIGRPIFGTLISLLYKEKPVLGIIDQPILGERWTGVSGFATNFNYEQIKSRSCKSLMEAVLCTTSPNLFSEKDLGGFEEVRKMAQYVVYGGDCYSYGLLARGSVDVVIETGLKPYDFCALSPIIEGAYGIITDWEGNKITYNSDGRILACGDRRLHAKILKMLG